MEQTKLNTKLETLHGNKEVWLKNFLRGIDIISQEFGMVTLGKPNIVETEMAIGMLNSHGFTFGSVVDNEDKVIKITLKDNGDLILEEHHSEEEEYHNYDRYNYENSDTPDNENNQGDIGL